MNDRTEHARQLAQADRWTENDLDGGTFRLKSWAKPMKKGDNGPLRIYIEGDGFAWVTRTRPSMDPTPKDPTGFELALADPRASVVYLGRPCQYGVGNGTVSCEERYWTSARFSEEVISAYMLVIDRLKAKTGRAQVELIGYSGGGALAVLVAARRNDIAFIRTVAGNLDPVEANRLHGAAPLTGSRDPLTVAPQLREVPQIHYAGNEDEVIPPIMAERFLAASGAPDLVRVLRVPGASHHEGWVERWPGLLQAGSSGPD